MGWSTPFLDSLATRRGGYVYGVRRVASASGFDSLWRSATQHRLPLWFAELGAHLEVGQGGAFTVREWASSSGGFSVPLVGEQAMRRHLQAVRQGSLIEVLAGVEGSDVADWQRVAIGQVVGRSGNAGPGWTLRCNDLLAAARSRLTTDSTYGKLFATTLPGTSFSTSVSGTAYTPGDASLFIDNDDFIGRDSSHGIGVVEVTDNSGGTFYLTYTGITGASSPYELTGVSATGKFGTTAAAAAASSANRVRSIGYLRGHPLNLAMRVLTSTGTASANGTYDTLPLDWGLALDEDLIDIAGIENVRDSILGTTVGGNPYRWEVLVTTPPTNGLSWLRDLLAQAGLILGMRQGQLTIRAVQDPYDAGAVFYGDITDAEIMDRSVDFQLEDPSAPGQQTLEVISDDGDRSTSPASVTALPWQDKRILDLSGAIRANDDDHLDEVRDRAAPWYNRTPARLTATWAGLRHAHRGIGDLVRFTALRLPLFGLAEAQAGTRYTDHPALITEHVVDWTGNRVRMTLALLPPEEGQ